MVDLKKHKVVKFLDIANIERTQKNKFYNADSILIQVSATNGQTYYIDHRQTVDSKFAVITPKNDISGRYLYIVLQDVLPEFLKRYQTGLNINPEIFKYLTLDIHTELETQKYVVEYMDKIQNFINSEEMIIEKISRIKEYHLDNMFCAPCKEKTFAKKTHDVRASQMSIFDYL